MKKDDTVYKFKYVKLTSTFNTFSDRFGIRAGFCLSWAAEGVGFGELTFRKVGKKTVCETECRSKEFVKQAFDFWFKTIRLENK